MILNQQLSDFGGTIFSDSSKRLMAAGTRATRQRSRRVAASGDPKWSWQIEMATWNKGLSIVMFDCPRIQMEWQIDMQFNSEEHDDSTSGFRVVP